MISGRVAHVSQVSDWNLTTLCETSWWMEKRTVTFKIWAKMGGAHSGTKKKNQNSRILLVLSFILVSLASAKRRSTQAYTTIKQGVQSSGRDGERDLWNADAFKSQIYHLSPVLLQCAYISEMYTRCTCGSSNRYIQSHCICPQKLIAELVQMREKVAG